MTPAVDQLHHGYVARVRHVQAVQERLQDFLCAGHTPLASLITTQNSSATKKKLTLHVKLRGPLGGRWRGICVCEKLADAGTRQRPHNSRADGGLLEAPTGARVNLVAAQVALDALLPNKHMTLELASGRHACDRFLLSPPWPLSV